MSKTSCSILYGLATYTCISGLRLSKPLLYLHCSWRRFSNDPYARHYRRAKNPSSALGARDHHYYEDDDRFNTGWHWIVNLIHEFIRWQSLQRTLLMSHWSSNSNTSSPASTSACPWSRSCAHENWDQLQYSWWLMLLDGKAPNVNSIRIDCIH